MKSDNFLYSEEANHSTLRFMVFGSEKITTDGSQIPCRRKSHKYQPSDQCPHLAVLQLLLQHLRSHSLSSLVEEPRCQIQPHVSFHLLMGIEDVAKLLTTSVIRLPL